MELANICQSFYIHPSVGSAVNLSAGLLISPINKEVGHSSELSVVVLAS